MHAPRSIVTRPLTWFQPYAQNPKLHPERQLEVLESSLREYGWTYPILARSSGEVIAGHGRLLAAQRLGLETAPVIIADHLSEEQVRAYRLVDNRSAELGEWGKPDLSAEIRALAAEGVSLAGLGFSHDDLKALMGTKVPGGTPLDPEHDYTRKIVAPIYEPKEAEAPPCSALVDTTRRDALRAEIEAAEGIPEDVRAFLLLAAERHLRFQYRPIAEFYCHADERTQRLMEASALVIIDYEHAIEKGFVKLSKRLLELADEDRAAAGGTE